MATRKALWSIFTAGYISWELGLGSHKAGSTVEQLVAMPSTMGVLWARTAAREAAASLVNFLYGTSSSTPAPCVANRGPNTDWIAVPVAPSMPSRQNAHPVSARKEHPSKEDRDGRLPRSSADDVPYAQRLSRKPRGFQYARLVSRSPHPDRECVRELCKTDRNGDSGREPLTPDPFEQSHVPVLPDFIAAC